MMMIRIPKNKLVYTGSQEMTNTCPLRYKYLGQTGRVGKVLYTTNSRKTAKGYALCLGSQRGWLRKYKVRNQLFLPNISAEQLHYEGDEVEKEFCAKGYKGYYLRWPDKVEEIVFCDPATALKLAGLRKCVGKNTFQRAPGCMRK